MLKTNISVTSKKRFKFFSSFVPTFLRLKMLKIWKAKMRSIFGVINPLVLRVKSSCHVCSNCDGFFKKNWKNSFICHYTWLSCATDIKIEPESHLNVKKYLSLSQDFVNWKNNLIMIFEIMVSLCIEICSNFVIFNIWVDWNITVI